MSANFGFFRPALPSSSAIALIPLPHSSAIVSIYRVFFLTGPALKVLCVGDGKIPTKKVKVMVCHRENVKFN